MKTCIITLIALTVGTTAASYGNSYAQQSEPQSAATNPQQQSVENYPSSEPEEKVEPNEASKKLPCSDSKQKQEPELEQIEKSKPKEKTKPQNAEEKSKKPQDAEEKSKKPQDAEEKSENEPSKAGKTKEVSKTKPQEVEEKSQKKKEDSEPSEGDNENPIQGNIIKPNSQELNQKLYATETPCEEEKNNAALTQTAKPNETATPSSNALPLEGSKGLYEAKKPPAEKPASTLTPKLPNAEAQNLGVGNAGNSLQAYNLFAAAGAIVLLAL
ncbi:hypothetical protein HK099_008349 [Clydaea vesicula]|uniref:Uncharacterized protein n=1 Tax=Clydaea vesicula TaxID=447962 RepID=A0AAD5TVX8_9FUNG|nr:hypothetical protein HK099_008349 [Clydaea vesicula]